MTFAPNIEHAKLKEVLVLVLGSRKRKIIFLFLRGLSRLVFGNSLFKEEAKCINSST
jgi:hypothetical protein